MKFYKEDRDRFNFCNKIRINKLNAICCDFFYCEFYKNGQIHNSKNAAYINYSGYKIFYLNNKLYGYSGDYTKQSWRKFIKLQFFL